MSSTSTPSLDDVQNPRDGFSQNPGSDAPDQDEDFAFSASFNDKTGILGSGDLIVYNRIDQTIEVSVPFPLAILLPEISGIIPEYPHISFETDRERNSIVLSIPIQHYVALVERPSSLPNGRPLPGVNGGEPPSFGFPLQVSGRDAYGYAAFDSFSIFVESGGSFPLQFGFPIKSNQTGAHLGQIYWVPKLGSHSAGVYLSVQLPKALSVILAGG
jgi:hypothetical protein